MDAFYVSVELRRRPELRGKPVVVGGDGPRGVVAAASYEARRFGVHSALASSIAKRRCPHAVFLPGDHAHYSEVSREVRDVFERYTPLVEPLSLDEAFLDVSGSIELLGDGPTIARALRAAIRDELQLGCSVGVAPNKFLAKLASVDAKPRASRDGIERGPGVVEIVAGEERAYLEPLPVERLWGVGPATLAKLNRIGIYTVADLTTVGAPALAASLGQSQARHLTELAVGHDDRPVEPDQAIKSISHEETYAEDLATIEELRTEVVRMSDAVARRLRRQKIGARTVALKLRFTDGFRTITRQTTTPEPIDQASIIAELLIPLLEPIDPTPGIRLVGVSGSNLGPVHQQLSFDDLAGAEPGTRESTVDEIRDRFGAEAIGPASAVRNGKLRTVRPGAQQWGPNQTPPE
ncbi:MAG: DNA polymerase IV [Ilumatobacteraceae bacterium]|nr:DNA polymerase IV [Ilumatobacteraceae bacterium]